MTELTQVFQVGGGRGGAADILYGDELVENFYYKYPLSGDASCFTSRCLFLSVLRSTLRHVVWNVNRSKTLFLFKPFECCCSGSHWWSQMFRTRSKLSRLLPIYWLFLPARECIISPSQVIINDVIVFHAGGSTQQLTSPLPLQNLSF